MQIYTPIIRDAKKSEKIWGALTEHLSRVLSGTRINLQVVDEATLESVVAASNGDFAVLDSGQYLRLEAQFRITRLAFITRCIPPHYMPYSADAAAIFARADRADINDITDLRRKSFMAADSHSFRGFHMAHGELIAHGINPYSDFASIAFSGSSPDTVVQAVLDCQIDAGAVPSDVLAEMEAEGIIEPGSIKLLNPQDSDNFPYTHSTRLYPPWVFVSLPNAAPRQILHVAKALLDMDGTDCDGLRAGWDCSTDLAHVHALYQKLRLPPYAKIITLPELDASLLRYLPVIRTISHDIRTPLNVILGLTDLMRDIYGNEDKEELNSYFDDVIGAAEHIAHLVTGVSEFAKAELGGDRAHYETLVIDQIENEIRELLGSAAEDLNLEFISPYSTEQCAEYLCQIRVRTLLFNLLTAMPKPPRIEKIRVSIYVESVYLRVAVSWVGFELYDLVKTDSPQLLPETLNDAVPAGHNLAIWIFVTKRLVQAHGGRAWTEALQNNEQTLYLDIPIKPA